MINNNIDYQSLSAEYLNDNFKLQAKATDVILSQEDSHGIQCVADYLPSLAGQLTVYFKFNDTKVDRVTYKNNSLLLLEQEVESPEQITVIINDYQSHSKISLAKKLFGWQTITPTLLITTTVILLAFFLFAPLAPPNLVLPLLLIAFICSIVLALLITTVYKTTKKVYAALQEIQIKKISS
jgi:hypothetical protein